MKARKELLIELSSLKAKLNCSIVCASIQYKPFNWSKLEPYDTKNIILPVNHTKEQYKTFLKEMTFEYNSGFGAQELFGVVWLTNDVALERQDYDGSEWWYLNYSDNIPAIPEECFAPGVTAQ